MGEIPPVIEDYSYTSAGLPTAKHVYMPTSSSQNQEKLLVQYAWDNEGQAVSVSYPQGQALVNNQITQLAPEVLTYTRDNLGRVTAGAYARNLQYDPAGQLTSADIYSGSGSTWWTETRTYNVLGQLTRQTVASLLDIEYGFPTANDGRIAWRRDNGEQVNYGYDSLGRLTSAATAGPEWGLSFTFDGFGNKTAQSVTKGSAPTWSQTIDPLTNRIASGGFGYSAGGNLQYTPYSPGGQLEYDQLNRMTKVDAVRRFWYDAANRRVWRSDNGIATFTLYGMDGMVLGTFEWKSRFNGFQAEYWVEKRQANRYLGQRLVWQDGKGILTDRLGSVQVRGTTETNTYYPYGEQKTGDSTQDRQKWGTYWRDSATGMDNAVNRWYSPTAGRFSTPDPYEASGGTPSPLSWNRYAYVEGDPVNLYDPAGLATCASLVGANFVSVFCTSAITGLSLGRTIPSSGPFNGNPFSTAIQSTTAAYENWMSDAVDQGIPQQFLSGFNEDLAHAIDALRSTQCSSLFARNEEFSDPLWVLDRMSKQNGFAYGKIAAYAGGREDGRTSPTGALTTVGPDPRLPLLRNGEAYRSEGGTIELNQKRWPVMSWRSRSLTILHELGHFYNMVQSAPGSQFLNDVSVPGGAPIASRQQFNGLLESRCISRF